MYILAPPSLRRHCVRAPSTTTLRVSDKELGIYFTPRKTFIHLQQEDVSQCTRNTIYNTGLILKNANTHIFIEFNNKHLIFKIPLDYLFVICKSTKPLFTV